MNSRNVIQSECRFSTEDTFWIVLSRYDGVVQRTIPCSTDIMLFLVLYPSEGIVKRLTTERIEAPRIDFREGYPEDRSMRKSFDEVLL